MEGPAFRPEAVGKPVRVVLPVATRSDAIDVALEASNFLAFLPPGVEVDEEDPCVQDARATAVASTDRAG